MQITKEQIIEIFQKNSIEHLFPLGGYVATVSKEHWIDVADEILTLLQSNDASQPNGSKPIVSGAVTPSYCSCGAEITEDDPYDGYCVDCG